MKRRVRFKVFIIFICLISILPIIVQARYLEKIESIKGKGTIAEPIFKVIQLQDTISKTINMETEELIYKFKIINYEEKNSVVRISQVDMNYNIDIINEDTNFPIKYELYEVGNRTNLLLDNNKTLFFLIPKDIKFEKEYELVVTWEKKDGNLSAEDNLKIIVNSAQVK